MKSKVLNNGLMLSCLVTLTACSITKPPLVAQASFQQCPAVTPCELRATNPKTNEDLIYLVHQVREDWAMCAAKVDMIVACQEELKNVEAERD